VNWLAFWASIIGSLAWPAAVIIVVLIFRTQLLKVAPWLRELEIGNVKLKFAEELAKASTAAAEIQAPAADSQPAVTDRDLMLAEHAPIGLVLRSWMTVDQAPNDAATRHDASPMSLRAAPAHRLIADLEARRVITPATAQTINYLRDLRNQVAHHGRPIVRIGIPSSARFFQSRTGGEVEPSSRGGTLSLWWIPPAPASQVATSPEWHQVAGKQKPPTLGTKALVSAKPSGTSG